MYARAKKLIRAIHHMSIFNFFRKKKRRSEEEQRVLDLAERFCKNMEKGGLLLRNIPFVPSNREVFYVSDGSRPDIDEYVAQHLDLIREKINDHGWHRFIYLPSLGQELAEDQAIWRKNYPDLPLPTKPLPSLPNDYLLQFRAHPHPDEHPVPPGFACYCKTTSEKSEHGPAYIFSYYPLSLLLAEHEPEAYFLAMHYCISQYPYYKGARYCLRKYSPDDADYDEKAKALLKEARESIGHLRRLGISDVVLKQALFPEPKLSPLHITSDHRILLPDFDNMEIKMEPLDKAVYFLFLRHPDGIILKHIADYREELAQLYERIKGRRPLKQLLGLRTYSRSILRLTDPLSNSLNEKLSHIRHAFSQQLNDEVASFYYVNGGQGLPKFIKLKPNMIHWELEATTEP